MSGFQIQFEAIDQASPTIQKLSQMMMDAASKSDKFASEIVNASTRIDTGLSKIPPKAQQAKEAVSGLHDAASQLQSKLLQFATVAGVTEFFKASADAALHEEEALRQLAFAVNSTGGSFDQSKQRIVDFAQQQESMTQYSHTQTYEVMGRLVRVMGDVGQAMQATRLVFGLASASGRDFNSVLDLMDPVLRGDASRLRGLKNEFGAFIGDATTAQGVIDALSKQFLGAAERQQGFAKEIASLKNRLEDFKEVVGVGALPALKFLLEVVVDGAHLFELLGTAIAKFAAKAVNDLQGLGQEIAAVFTGNFSRLPAIEQETINKFQAIQKASAEQMAEINRRYSRERTQLVEDEGQIKVRVSAKSIDQAEKEAAAEKKAAQDAHDTLTRLDAERLKLEGNDTDSKLKLIELEKDQRLRSLDELRDKEILTDQEIANARNNAMQIAALKSAEARKSVDEDMKAMEEAAKKVGESFSSSIGKALADVIVEGKNMQEAFDAAFKEILKTAIETFTRMAIESAVLRGSTDGMGMFGGMLAVGAFGSGAFKGIHLQEGGIVRQPTIAQVGEGGPEAVIPLNRLSSFGVGNSPQEVNITVTQNNTITVQGVNDENVREMMRRISEATRNGAAEGAELIKSILAKQDRFVGEAV